MFLGLTLSNAACCRYLAIIIPVVVGRNAESNLFLAAAAADTLQAMVEHASYIRCIKFLLSLAREDKRTGVKDSATLYAAYAALHTLSQPFQNPFHNECTSFAPQPTYLPHAIFSVWVCFGFAG